MVHVIFWAGIRFRAMRQNELRRRAVECGAMMLAAE